MPTRLTFGLVGSPQARSRFDELAAWMKEAETLDLVLKSIKTYKDLAMSVREGSSDIAWLPPVAYAWLAEAVTPLGSIVREGKTSYGAALVVRKESGIETLEDLKRVRAGWVDPWSAAGYVMPRLEIAKAGIQPHQAFASEKFYGTHTAALAALTDDACDVIGTYDGAWGDRDDIRVLARFSDIPNDIIAVRRNLAPAEYELALKAFRDACVDEKGRPLVQAVFDGDELRETLDASHEALRLAYEKGIANGLFD